MINPNDALNTTNRHSLPAMAGSSAYAGTRPQEYETPLCCFVSKEHLTIPGKRVSSRSAVELHAYSNRAVVLGHTGRRLDYRRAGKDFAGSRVFIPAGGPEVPALRVWQEADRIAEAQGRVVIISSHLVCRLPATRPEAWQGMIEHYVGAQMLPMGLIVEAAIHKPALSSPHVHYQISCREWLHSAAFGAPIYNATAAETREKWQRAWIGMMMKHAGH